MSLAKKAGKSSRGTALQCEEGLQWAYQQDALCASSHREWGRAHKSMEPLGPLTGVECSDQPIRRERTGTTSNSKGVWLDTEEEAKNLWERMRGQGRDISHFPEESGGRNRVTTAVNLEGNERDIEAEKRLYICSTLRVHDLLQFSQESEYRKGHLRNSRYVELTACGKFPFGHSICTTRLVICPPLTSTPSPAQTDPAVVPPSLENGAI